MNHSILTITYLIAGVLFILSLGGLSAHRTARRGALCGTVGIVLAIVATSLRDSGALAVIVLLLAVGGVVGIYVARRVEMTAMPQLVAILHSFVGLAAVLIGFNDHLTQHEIGTSVASAIHRGEVFVGVFVGALTFTGSVVAWAKLQGTISGRPLLLPARHLLNLLMLVLILLCGYFFVREGNILPLVVACLLAFVFGGHLVVAIGGADMPVVVSMLNSYSGWAAAATGFMLANDLLVIAGALVGSSGAILSYIMCRAMNRSFISVILGGFGSSQATTGAQATAGNNYLATDAGTTAELLQNAGKVIIVPGYGMAVAQAQHAIKEISSRLTASGVSVKFAIHPVAGRLPGHMNVLLAEAGVPYSIVVEMDDINGEFKEADAVLVIGANDIVNPGAMSDQNSSIYGMPVLQAWDAKQVIVLKRSMASGYSGVDNPLFYRENTRMLFGDAKKSSDDILALLQQQIQPQQSFA